MSDNVRIDGFGPGVKQWATEETMKQVLKQLTLQTSLSEKQLKALEKGVKGASSGNKDDFKDLEKALKELEDNITDVNETLDEANEELEDFRDNVEDANSSTSLFSSVLGVAATTIGYFTGILANQADSYTEAVRSGMALSSGLDGVTVGVGTFVKSVYDANLTFEKMADLQREYGATLNYYGITTFAQTSRSMTKSLGALGLNAEETASMLAEYMDTQRLLGYQGNMRSKAEQQRAQNAIEMFDRWSKVLGKSREEIQKQSNEQLKQVPVQAFLQTATEDVKRAFEEVSTSIAGTNFGPTLMEALAQPIIQQSSLFTTLAEAGAADVGNALMDLQEAMKSGDITEARKQQDRFFEMLGNSNVDLSMILQNQEMTGLIAEMKAYNQQRKQLDQEDLKQRDAILRGTTAFKDGWAEITKVLHRVAAQIWTPEMESAIGNLFGNIGNHLKDFSKTVPELSKRLASYINDLAGLDWSGMIVSLTNGIEWAVQLVKEPFKTMSKLFETEVKNMDDVFDFLSGKFKTAASDLLSMVGSAIPPMLTALAIAIKDTVVNAVSSITWEDIKAVISGSIDFVGDILSKGAELIGDAIMDLGGELVDGVKNLEWDSIATAFAVGVGGLFAASWLKDKVANSISSLFNVFGGSDSDSGKKQKAGGSKVSSGKPGKLGGFLTSITSSLGAGVGALLTGLATGLRAFASPQVAAGGLALGAVIAAVGAGFAGATWLVGKSLDTFAEGMKNFEDMDGDNLSKVGQGIADLGLGLAGLGAGNVLNAIGNIGSALGDLVGLGSDSPFETIEKFAQNSSKFSQPLLQLGEALKLFAPNFAMFTQALENEINFDFEDLADQLEDVDFKELNSKLNEINTTGAYDEIVKLTSSFADFNKTLLSLSTGELTVLKAKIDEINDLSLPEMDTTTLDKLSISLATVMAIKGDVEGVNATSGAISVLSTNLGVLNQNISDLKLEQLQTLNSTIANALDMNSINEFSAISLVMVNSTKNVDTFASSVSNLADQFVELNKVMSPSLYNLPKVINIVKGEEEKPAEKPTEFVSQREEAQSLSVPKKDEINNNIETMTKQLGALISLAQEHINEVKRMRKLLKD